MSDILPRCVPSNDPADHTIGPILFDLATLGTGTGTGLNTVTLGLIVGPDTLDAVDIDPSANANIGWWYTRKFFVQNNSNPAGEDWQIQGAVEPFKVRTKRIIPATHSSLWLCVRPDFNGFTALQTTISWIATVMSP